MNLFNPLIKINIGSYELNSGVEAEITSSQESYSDWSKITIEDNLYKKLNLSKNDLVDIEIGYENQYYNVFSGNIQNINSNIITCNDDMLKLEKAHITNTFINCVPQEIINYCLNKAEIANKNISTDNYNVRSTLPIVNKNCIDVLKNINSYWKLNYKFYFKDRIFYWGSKETNTKVYSFIYQENIINLSNENVWILETVASPFIRHSDIINIEHPKLSGQKEVKKVKHKFQNGYTRSLIYV